MSKATVTKYLMENGEATFKEILRDLPIRRESIYNNLAKLRRDRILKIRYEWDGVEPVAIYSIHPQYQKEIQKIEQLGEGDEFGNMSEM